MSPRSRSLLLHLYPLRWRQRYRAEFGALLDATPLTLLVVIDVVRHACAEHVASRPRAARAAAPLAAFAVLDAATAQAGITDNILWAPDTPLRALMLTVTVAPLVALVISWRHTPTAG